MKVEILVLEDVEDWGETLCENLNLLDEAFFNDIGTEISKIEATLAINSKKALEIIQKQNVDLLTIDIKLNEEDEGHEFYEKMFLKGIDIPSIVISGEVDTPGIRNQIVGRGIPIIIRKLSGKSDLLHIRVAKAICEVLDGQRHLVFQLETYVTHYDLWDSNLEHNEETKIISKWIDSLINDDLSREDRVKIRKKIINKCIEQSKFEQHLM